MKILQNIFFSMSVVMIIILSFQPFVLSEEKSSENLMIIDYPYYLNNTTLYLNKHLIIKNNGLIEFFNVTIIAGDWIGITIEKDGKFFAKNCTFTSKPPMIWIGIEIYSNNVSIINSIISNSYYGISVEGYEISPLIEGNVLQGNGIGIKAKQAAEPIIINNTIIFTVHYGLKINGYLGPFSKTIIANNKFIANRVAILLYPWSSAVIENATLVNNYIGVKIQSSTLIINNSTFINSYQWDFYIYKGGFPTRIKLFNTTFDESKVYFEDYDSTIETPNKILRKERDYSLYISMAIVITTITLIIIGMFLYKRRKIRS